ncbi:hypothetical protein A6395_04110 [Exiguobacterium sp. SH31]|nr:hypothetical protein A6395_04110 [Exiguobacterium sp. SH31]
MCGGCHQVGALDLLGPPVEREAEPVKLFRVGERALHGLRPETIEVSSGFGQTVPVHQFAIGFIKMTGDDAPVGTIGRTLLEKRAVLTDGGVGGVVVIPVSVCRSIGETLFRRADIDVFF